MGKVIYTAKLSEITFENNNKFTLRSNIYLYLPLFNIELLVLGGSYSNWKREDFCRPTGQQIDRPRN